ncbi:MAG: hypothetical protein HRT53_16110 [Colwellia sp.]|nr:hypothetical protein [Colwellia sp.]
MKRYSLLAFYLLVVSTAVADDNIHQQVTLKGKWLIEESGKSMLDPQTSALKLWRGKLLTLSDGSAHSSQQKQLHIIESSTGLVDKKSMTMVLSENVENSCFSKYLADKPDFEALVVDSANDGVFIVVTEDARTSEQLSVACQKRFQNTGSTVYPSLLVRLKLMNNNVLLMTHVKPIQFKLSDNIGNFPNDGIEAMAIGKNATLYLGLEKDNNDNTRIFSLRLTKHFWRTDGFIQVEDTGVLLPRLTDGGHPINGMDYIPIKDHLGYLVAAARNDDQLWIIDLEKQKPTKIISLKFLAPIAGEGCHNSNFESIIYTSLEGVAVDGDKVWLINDPWPKHYIDNVKCAANRKKYKNLSPLIFSLPISKQWFE